MRLRATVTIRNEPLLAARERLGLTQEEAAEWCGVTLSLFGRLERLEFPKTYPYENAALIANALHVNVEDIFPEELVGWRGETKVTYTQDVKPDRLLEYKNKQEGHYILPSPDEQVESSIELERMCRLVAGCTSLTKQQRRVIELRYGLGPDGEPKYLTLSATARVLGVGRERVRQCEAMAIRKLQRWASSSILSKVMNEGVDR